MPRMRLELRLSLLYFALATLWIILSDALLAAVAVPEIVSAAQTYKGALFVFVTSLLLFVLLSREMGRRRKADRAAREGEMKFSYLFLNNPLPMWIYDLETLAFLDVNQAAIDQYGYSRAEFLSLKITDIRPPEDVPRLMENLAEARPALQRSGLWRHRLKNGQIIYVDIVSYEVRFDGCAAALVVAHNVTESIRARRDLQESSERLKAVFNASPVAIFVFDTEGRIRLSNPAAEQMYGWGAAELIGQRPPFVPPDKTAEFDALIRRALTDEIVTNFETERVRRDGELVQVSISTAAIHDADSAVYEVVAVDSDITERKRMEADLLEKEKLRLALNKEVELRNMRDRFMSMVSHEFRNPLSVIVSSGDMLERYYPRLSEESRSEHFANIRTYASRLTDMLDDILALLRAESIGPEFKPTPVDLAQLCEKAVGEARLKAQNQWQIHFANLSGQTIIKADEKLLRHALNNLLSNAMKYSPPQSVVSVKLWQDDQRLHIQVADQGIGIPPENLKRLFEPFYRAENVGDIPGTGLGLAITKQAVELHNGQLEVESAVGLGSVFTIHLPASLTT